MKHFRTYYFMSLLVFCIVSDAICGFENKTDYSKTIEQTTAFIEHKMPEEKITGLSIALVDGQDMVWAQGFGFANKEKGIKATPETIYEIGSLSKTISATAIMHLRDHGLLDIDHALAKYIPEFSILPPPGFPLNPDNPITVRTMLTHHSGLPGDLQNGGFTLKPRTDYNAWILGYLKGSYACYPPGFIWAYSNTAYSLLGEVVSRVSGQSFEEYTDGLFEKMGMHHSSYFHDKPVLKENTSRGYLRGIPLKRFCDNMWAAGGVRSNATDMARYIMMVLGRGRIDGAQILKPETLNEMLTIQNGNIPLDLDLKQGLAWVLVDRELGDTDRLCNHTGSTNGFFSHIEILPDYQLGVVVLTNTEKAVIALEAARKALKLAVKDKTGIELEAPGWTKHSPYTTWPPEKLEPLAGMYATEGGYDIIKAVPGGLEWWSSYGDKTQKLLPLENGWFAPPDSQELLVEFSAISGHDVMIFHGDVLLGLIGRSLWGEKIEPAPVPAAWKDRAGKYSISNLYPDDCSRYLPREVQPVSHSIEIAVKDGLLVLGFTLQAKSALLVLDPISDTVARIRGLGRNRGGAVQVLTVNGKERIQIWGGLYAKP
jgi:CubicO group peptidase (beta-lactamase class C family)